MHKIIFFIALLGLGLASCSKEVPTLSKQEMSKRIDSAIKASTMESDTRARQDLERRMKIEVKVKVDSILRSHMKPVAADTAAKSTANNN